MFCKYCGTEIKGQAFFCPQCGARLEQQDKKEGQPVKKRKLSGKTAFFGIAAGAAIIMAGAAFGISMLRGNPSGQAEEVGQGPQEPLNNIEDAALHKAGGDEYPVVLHAYSAVDVITEGDSIMTGDMLQNVSALVREGEGNQTGEVILTADTKSGELSMNLTSGVYTVQLHADGYLDIYVKIEVAEESATKDVYVMPQLNEGQTGVVLTWEGEEADLDLTLFTPYQAENGDMAHIGGSVKEDGRGNVLVSDNKGRCEAMYVNSGETGSYKLYVNDYTDSMAGNYMADTLGRINVHIYIYNSAGFVAEYTMPLGQDGVVWEVLELNGNTITPAQRVYSEVSGKNWWMEDKTLPVESEVEAYINVLYGNKDKWDKSGDMENLENYLEYLTSFILMDIDDDNVKELYISDRPSNECQLWYILDYCDGTVDILRSYWQDSTVKESALLKNGTIFRYASSGLGSSQGSEYYSGEEYNGINGGYTVSAIQADGSLEVILDTFSQENITSIEGGNEMPSKYFINNEEVSYDTYCEYVDTYINSNIFAFDDYGVLTEENLRACE